MKLIILMAVLRALGPRHAEEAVTIANVLIDESENAPVALDPLLIAAIAKHESGFHAKAISADGLDVGLMQLRRGVSTHLSIRDLQNPRKNVHEGIQIFLDHLTRCETLPRTLAAYNTGRCAPVGPVARRARRYVREVLKEYEHLQREVERADADFRRTGS